MNQIFFNTGFHSNASRASPFFNMNRIQLPQFDENGKAYRRLKQPEQAFHT